MILEDCFSIGDASNGAHTLTLDSGATKTMVGRLLKNLVENAEKMEKPSRIHFPNGQSANIPSWSLKSGSRFIAMQCMCRNADSGE